MVFDRSNGVYRSIFAALFGLALVGASEPPKSASQSDSGDKPGEIAKTLQEIAATIKDAQKTDQTAQPCPKNQDNRNSDLCAQWKAADAAKDGAYWGWWQVLLGSGGVVIGLFTLAAAATAAIYAKKAAIETEKGADAALGAVAQTMAANEIAEASAHRQLRAYIGVDNVDHTTTTLGDIRCYLINIKNYGATPAIDVRYAWEITAHNRPNFENLIWKDEYAQRLAPSQTWGLPASYDFSLESGLDQIVLHLILEIRYSDCNGKKWGLRQRYQTADGDETAWHTSQHGNGEYEII